MNEKVGVNQKPVTAQEMKFSIKGFFNKCDQIRRKLRIWLHLLKKSLMENLIFCAVSSVVQMFSESFEIEPSH